MHMVQHMLFTFVAAPLLLTGTPAWMWRALLRPAPVRAVWRVPHATARGPPGRQRRPVLRPLARRRDVVGPVRVRALLAPHVAAGLRDRDVVAGAVAAAGAAPDVAAGSVMYLFFQSLAPTIPASFLTFGTEPLYPIYATFPRIWGIDALTDQLIAGLVMKIVGGAILWVEITAIFFRWGHEETTQGWDATSSGTSNGMSARGWADERSRRAAEPAAADPDPRRGLAVIVLVLYTFSRVLLSVKPNAATGVALVAAAGTMTVAAFVSSRRSVTGATLGSFVGAAAGIAMAAGGIAIVVIGPPEEEIPPFHARARRARGGDPGWFSADALTFEPDVPDRARVRQRGSGGRSQRADLRRSRRHRAVAL